MKERLDKLLFDLGHVDTRSKAKTIIEKGLVEVNGKLVKKAGEKVQKDSEIKILTDKIYVSRAAYKIVEAIKTFRPELESKIAADVGASTGGFTQVLLENGVAKVYAIDVGHDQLNPLLKEDERVINQEGINIKYPHELPEKVDLAVTDLSFISLRLVFDNIWNLVKEGGFVIALIKPQFEAGRERMGKDAVIRDDKLRQEVLNEVLTWFDENGYKYQAVIDSPITGKDGNYEYLCLINSKE
jgi:23S rRNA (cytidine1920-2'-O)/16S rRNA (cytidine1409-2'-O)-methyltransferase